MVTKGTFRDVGPPRGATESSCVLRDAYRVEQKRNTQYDIRNTKNYR